MVFSSPGRDGPIMSPDHALERRIFDAYQEVKRARRDGDYASYLRLDERSRLPARPLRRTSCKSSGVDVRVITGHEKGAL